MICSVGDCGVGIAPESIAFGPFPRLDNTETRSIGGTGLGLALVKNIIEAHGGPENSGRETAPLALAG